MNEGLEALGTKDTDGEGDVFSRSEIESVKIPSTLRRLEAGTFYQCEKLKNVELQDGLEYIGGLCFYRCDIDEITLPGTLKEIDKTAFEDCRKFHAVWVGEGCPADVWRSANNSVIVLSVK